MRKRGRVMPNAVLEPLSTVELMNLYGKIRFSWDLRKDTINWRGPVEKLFSSHVPLLTGASFLHRLQIHDFWSRFQQIYEDLNKGSQEYSARYQVVLPGGELCFVEEDGIVLGNATGAPVVVEGSIAVSLNQEGKDENGKALKDLSGYDALTGYPTREVLLENLAVRLDQVQDRVAPGGYLAFAIDKLNLMFFAYGLDVLRAVIKEVGNQLRLATRFDDFIGRSSGCTFGMILNDADEWGVMQAAERLSLIAQQIQIQIPSGILTPIISVGGVAFHDEKDPLVLITSAERSLFEMQNVKGVGTFAQQGYEATKHLERPDDAGGYERRLADSVAGALKDHQESQQKEAHLPEDLVEESGRDTKKLP